MPRSPTPTRARRPRFASAKQRSAAYRLGFSSYRLQLCKEYPDPALARATVKDMNQSLKTLSSNVDPERRDTLRRKLSAILEKSDDDIVEALLSAIARDGFIGFVNSLDFLARRALNGNQLSRYYDLGDAIGRLLAAASEGRDLARELQEVVHAAQRLPKSVQRGNPHVRLLANIPWHDPVFEIANHSELTTLSTDPDDTAAPYDLARGFRALNERLERSLKRATRRKVQGQTRQGKDASGRLSVSIQEGRITLDGTKYCNIDQDACAWVEALRKEPRNWISMPTIGQEFRQLQNVRPMTLRKKLPPEIANLIESTPGKGRRLMLS